MGGQEKQRSSESKKSAQAPALERDRRPAGNTPKQNAAWLVRLRKWRTRLGRTGARAGRMAEAIEAGKGSPRKLKRRLRPLAECPRTLREKVGEPGAPRFRRSYELYTEACESVSRWALDLEDTASEGEAALAELRAREKKVATAFEDAAINLESSLLAFKALPTAGGPARGSRIEPRLGRALNRLLYRSATAASIEVRCWSKRDWPLVKREFRAYAGIGDFAGFADDPYHVSIAPEYCAELVRLMYKHRRPTSGVPLAMTAAAVGLLAHEGGHLSDPTANEARTECYGVQRIRELAPILGTSRSYGDLLADVYWTYIYPREQAEYRTPACRNGTKLDRNPSSDVWP